MPLASAAVTTSAMPTSTVPTSSAGPTGTARTDTDTATTLTVLSLVQAHWEAQRDLSGDQVRLHGNDGSDQSQDRSGDDVCQLRVKFEKTTDELD
jgi:hypothetical protein